jgi:hypothetical protein
VGTRVDYFWTKASMLVLDRIHQNKPYISFTSSSTFNTSNGVQRESKYSSHEVEGSYSG